MPISKRLYPYAVSTGLSIRPVGAPFDPDNDELEFDFLVRDDESDDDVQALDLTNSTLPWISLQIDIEVSLAADELQRVLPLPSRPESDASLLLTTTCSETRLRTAFPLEYADGVWNGSVTIRRDQARGAVKLLPRLVRTTDLPHSDTSAGHATVHGLIIAEGRSLSIRVDPMPRNLDGILQIRWEDFPESTNPWLKCHSADLFYLEYEDPQPILFLNSHNPELKAALHSKSKSGGTAVMRHLGNALIAQTVWLQLFQNVAATVEADLDAGEIDVPSFGWRKHVLRTLLPRAFPGLDEAEQIRQLAALASEGRDSSLSAVLVSAAQNAAKTTQLVNRAAGAAAVSLDGASS